MSDATLTIPMRPAPKRPREVSEVQVQPSTKKQKPLSDHLEAALLAETVEKMHITSTTATTQPDMKPDDEAAPSLARQRGAKRAREDECEEVHKRSRHDLAHGLLPQLRSTRRDDGSRRTHDPWLPFTGNRTIHLNDGDLTDDQDGPIDVSEEMAAESRRQIGELAPLTVTLFEEAAALLTSGLSMDSPQVWDVIRRQCENAEETDYHIARLSTCHVKAGPWPGEDEFLNMLRSLGAGAENPSTRT